VAAAGGQRTNLPFVLFATPVLRVAAWGATRPVASGGVVAAWVLPTAAPRQAFPIPARLLLPPAPAERRAAPPAPRTSESRGSRTVTTGTLAARKKLIPALAVVAGAGGFRRSRRVTETRRAGQPCPARSVRSRRCGGAHCGRGSRQIVPACSHSQRRVCYWGQELGAACPPSVMPHYAPRHVVLEL